MGVGNGVETGVMVGTGVDVTGTAVAVGVETKPVGVFVGVFVGGRGVGV